MSYCGPDPANECDECGAPWHGVHRPYGGHYPFCSYFNASRAIEEEREDVRKRCDPITPTLEAPDEFPY